ncbi:unnamed protein product, partial [Polarella glacialis]
EEPQTSDQDNPFLATAAPYRDHDTDASSEFSSAPSISRQCTEFSEAGCTDIMSRQCSDFALKQSDFWKRKCTEPIF